MSEKQRGGDVICSLREGGRISMRISMWEERRISVREDFHKGGGRISMREGGGSQ